CAQTTAMDNIKVDNVAKTMASKSDLERVERILDVLLGEMKDVIAHLKHLEAVPEIARETLKTALVTKKRLAAAAQRLREQCLQLGREQPESAVIAIAEAAAQEARGHRSQAAASLARASRLSPGDPKLADLSQRIGVKPTPPAPDAKSPNVDDIFNGWKLEKQL